MLGPFGLWPAALALILMGLVAAPGPWTSAQAQSLFEWEREAWRDGRRQQEDRRGREQRRAEYCRKLEQRLVQQWRRSNQNRSELPALRKELREAEDEFRAVKAKADRRNCYEETFFFGRSLRRTPECMALDREARKAQRQVKSLRDRIDRFRRSGTTQNRQDELIAELARYGCGEDYERQYEARRPSFFSFFDDRGTSFREPQQRRSPSELPFATYRTMCVRQCDGYYFPVSFSTLPSQFQADQTQCRDRCAAPTQLFVYRNPGEDVESMVSLDGKPYTELENAWLYRQKFIKGCSCDAAEYSEADIAQSIAELKGQSARLDAGEDGGESGDQDLTIHEVPEDESFDPRRR
jgi:HPt (histidine-containing phosphotransfer) domain-containing protein